MSNKNENLHILKRVPATNSLEGKVNNGLPVQVILGCISDEQADAIIARAVGLQEYMLAFKSSIYILYDKEPTDKLIFNFNEIISYSSAILEKERNDHFDNYFQKLNGFCGQIENIMKMIRYYNSIFEPS